MFHAWRKLWRMAQSLYADLPYHRWEHAVSVLEQSLYLSERLKGQSIDLDVVRMGSIFHDIAYGLVAEDYHIATDDGCRRAASKEEVAADLAQKLLARYGVPRAIREQVGAAILATSPFGPIASVEAAIVAAADLALAARDYATFHRQSEALRRERAMLEGKSSVPLKTYWQGATGYLGLFSARRIERSPHYYTGEASAFHLGLLRNLLKKNQAVFGSTLQIVGELGCLELPSITDCLETRLTDPALYIGIGPDTSKLQRALGYVSAYYRSLGAQSMPVGVPSEKQAISLPSQSLHRLYIPLASAVAYARYFPAQEVQRVLKPEAEVHVIEIDRLPAHPPLRESADTRSVMAWLKRDSLTHVGETHLQHGWEFVFRAS